VKADVSKAMAIKLSSNLPPDPVFDPQYRRAPNRGLDLTEGETVVALKNALRYIPESLHKMLAPEFLNELRTRGRIYGYRYRPPGIIKAKPVDEYKGILETRALQLMIDNNLDFDVALYPYELVTYGENGQVCQNWMQYRLIKKYLETMTEEQTLVVSSGHPVGPSRSSDGEYKLWSDDCGWLDVYWSSRHRSRDMHHTVECRPAVPRSG